MWCWTMLRVPSCLPFSLGKVLLVEWVLWVPQVWLRVWLAADAALGSIVVSVERAETASLPPPTWNKVEFKATEH